MSRNLLLLLALILSLLLSSPAIEAATYDVGPSQPLATLSAVPWATLQPGDFVNIHSKPGGYHEKIQISASGSAAAHIVIRGIPDPVTGALPILDGKNAVDDPSIDWRNQVFSNLGLIVVSPRKATYLYGAYHISYVDIETLDIRNALYTADGSITYTDQFGAVRGYDSFACGIYIEWAHDLAIRGCEISNCCNGIFANSKNGAAQSSARLLIEKNYFHDNSLPLTLDPANPSIVLSNAYHEHHCYIESAGVTYQYNRFGQLRPGAHGCAIKDRSSGQVIRYNSFDMNEESNVLALLDPQGGAGYLDVQPDYLDSFVYGNLVTIENYTSGISAFWWGAYNSTSSYPAQHRGTLYFYNNTIVNHHNGVDLFFLPSTTYTGTNATFENVDCRNNIFYSDTTVQSSIYTTLHFYAVGTTNGGGNINLGVNWISPNWLKDSPNHAYSGSLIGTANLIVGDAQGANNAHFVDINLQDYHVLTGANTLDAAAPLSPQVLPAYDDTLEYLAPQSFQLRVQQGNAMDLGALESTGAAPPPPAGGALQFSTTSYSVTESGTAAVITVTRTGGSTGLVSVSYSTQDGSALAGSDYTIASGVLSWPDGDTTPKTFTVPITNDNLVEPTEMLYVLLSSPVGGAVLGARTGAALSILDDDSPSILLYGLTATSNSIIAFKSDAPGVILSSHAVTGLASGEILRGLAIQPGTGTLFAVSSASKLYTVNPFTGTTTAVGSAFSPALASASIDLAFDRLTGVLRLVNQAGQNLQLNPATGLVLSVDTSLTFASGDAQAATTPLAVGADYAYSNGAETLYVIDAANDVLARVGSLGGSPVSPNAGTLATIGALGLDTAGNTSLDIQPGASFAWSCFTLPNATSSGLYTIGLTTGSATLLGTIGVSEPIRDVVVAPARDFWRLNRFGGNAGNAQQAGDAADPDGNGMSNLMEYALGVPAGNGSGARTATPQLAVSGNYLTLTFTRPTSASDVIYTVQVSSDLNTWNDGSTYSTLGNISNNTYTTELSRTMANGIETITVQDNMPISSAARRFVRLSVKGL